METAKDKRIQKLFKKFLETQDGEKIIEAQIAEETAKRANLIKSNKSLNDDLAKTTAALIEAQDAYQAELKKNDDEKLHIYQQGTEKISPLKGKQSNLEAEINNNETLLRESADPAIDEAIAYFRNLHAQFRHVVYKTIRTPTGRITPGGIAEYTIETTKDALEQGVFYVRAALVELDAMKITDAKANMKRIDDLKANVPDVNQYSKKTVMSDYTNEDILALQRGN